MDLKAILLEAVNAIKRAGGIKPKTPIEISALRWEIYASIQNILDAISMIIADLNLRKASSYSDLGRILCETNLISEEGEDDIKTITIVRNTLAHAYRKISEEDLQRIRDEILPRAERAAKELLKIVEQKNLDPKSNLNVPKGLIKTLGEHGVLLAYIFGSRARGNAREDSDYDVAVLFSNDDASIIDEINLAVELADALNEPVEKIDVVSLNRADLLIKARVLKEGIPIYYVNEEFKRRWERKTLIEILDGSDMYAIYANRALKKIRQE